jgi:putative DNA primase/helicase
MGMEDTEREMSELLIAALTRAETTGEWTMPWDRDDGFPLNPTTGRAYAGSFNGFVLMMTATTSHGGDQRWAGFGQWKKAGNPVKKGEEGTEIYFPRFKCGTCGTSLGWAKKCRNGHQIAKPTDKKWSGWGTSFVFNNQQTAEPVKSVEVEDIDPKIGFEKAADILKAMGSDLRHGGGRAFYRPSEDSIHVPEPGKFLTVADYWATVMHEHAHWTGHGTRLDRPGITDFSGFGSEAYAFEELCAEIGAAFVCKHIGVTRTGLFENHVAYLASWKKKLKDDPSAIRRAIQEAGKIMRFLTK